MVWMKHPVARSKKWALVEWADIPSRNDPEMAYLRRLRILQTPWFSVMLHLIFESDSDRDPHDHPWNFWSLVLRGGYTEEVYAGLGDFPDRKTHRRGSVHRMPIEFAHRITEIRPKTVTLIVTGPRVREFCFWTKDGLVPWRDYVRDSE